MTQEELDAFDKKIRAEIGHDREPNEREMDALRLLPANGFSNGSDWLVGLYAAGLLNTVGSLLANGWVMIARLGRDCDKVGLGHGIRARLYPK